MLIDETVENLGAWDRPIAWTQHVTLGPAVPRARQDAIRSRQPRSRERTTAISAICSNARWSSSGRMAPLTSGGVYDLRVYSDRDVSAGFTTHLMDPSKRDEVRSRPQTPALRSGIDGSASDFPWLGIWEENQPAIAARGTESDDHRGMEFGVSPQPESRRAMIDRGSLFGVPGLPMAAGDEDAHGELLGVFR